MLGEVLGGIGLVATGVSIYVAVRVTRRFAIHEISVDLSTGTRIDPQSLGLGDSLEIIYKGTRVSDLRVFELTVYNRGKRDIFFDISRESRKERKVFFPRVRFQGLRVLGFHTLNYTPESFRIMPSVESEHTLWINISNLGRGKSACFQVVGASSSESISATLYKGNVPDLEVKGSGLLRWK